MRSFAALSVALGLLAAACGGASSVAPAAPAADTVTTAPATDSASTTIAPTTEGSSGTDEATTTAAPAEDLGDPAPDFILTLGEGGSEFSLSQEVMPVYMVFWAEW